MVIQFWGLSNTRNYILDPCIQEFYLGPPAFFKNHHIISNFLLYSLAFWSHKMEWSDSKSLAEEIQKYSKAWQIFWSFCKFREMSSASRHFRSLVVVIEKYWQAWQTFWSFFNFTKMSRHSRSLLEVIQKYLQAWQIFWSFYNFKRMF